MTERWWGRCDDCGLLIDNPAHVLGCAPPGRTIGNGLNDDAATGDDHPIGPL